MPNPYDVIVVGAGNAALSAAIAARESCPSVLVVEKAPEYFRGGNTYFTGGIIRFAFDGLEDIKTVIPDMSPTEEDSVDVGSYTEDQFYDDMMRVTQGNSDPELAQILVSQSRPTMQWLRSKGVRFVLSYGRQAFKDESTGKFRFWGGLLVEAVGAGKGLSDQQFDVCRAEGIDIRYSTQVVELLRDGKGHVNGVRVLGPDGHEDVSTATPWCWRRAASRPTPRCAAATSSPGWELVKVRGIPYNTGDGIRMALEAGAMPHGHWSSCHAVAWDLNAPAYGDRTITELYQKHSYPFGIIVNLNGERFLDEGYDFRNYTYVTYGRALLTQPQGVAFQIFDDKVKHLLRDEYHIPAGDYGPGRQHRGAGPPSGHRPRRTGRRSQEVQRRRPRPTSPTTRRSRDGRRTVGLNPDKTNWAQPIDTPPYLGYAVTCGISFTFGGVRIDNRGRVLNTSLEPIPGLYAAGEMVGGLFYHNYPGGSGLAAGMVFGRLAGNNAAEHAAALRD